MQRFSMQRRTLSLFSLFTTLLLASPHHSRAQQTSAPPVISTQPGPDPLAVGVAALQHGDYAGAKTFFTNFLAGSPNDLDARLFLGAANLSLKDYPSAIQDFRAVIAAKPTDWAAHQDLVLADALTLNWFDFDKERALLQAARDTNAPGIDKPGSDLIDKLQVGSKTYQVLSFYNLTGHFHARYVIVHFGEENKPTDYIECESDDVDQAFFKEKHPDLAAAGKRSFSLDFYSNEGNGQMQALIKFYPDGEPTYETVRADALKTLQARAAAPPAPPASK
jgi:tetratricopeptide (TPR) repeat protein